ncbi:MAG: hypothetical protein V7L20_15685 [Nostoc sp.]|uniref:hypothetical protein n=1 Tax=Nostoc sp. TaxID=1180 RepID=UPI002FFA31CF
MYIFFSGSPLEEKDIAVINAIATAVHAAETLNNNKFILSNFLRLPDLIYSK